MALTTTNKRLQQTADLDQALGLFFSKIRGDKAMADAAQLEETFRKVERAKRQWEAAVDALPELIFIIDSQQRIIRANRAVENWQLGSVYEIQGCELHWLVHPSCNAPCHLGEFLQAAGQKALEQGLGSEREFYEPFWRRHIQVRVWPSKRRERSPEHQHMVVIITDISERKLMEQSLRQNNRQLQALNEINQAILTAQSSQDIAATALHHLHACTRYRHGCVLLADAHQEQMHVLAYKAIGRPPVLEADKPLPRAALMTPGSRHIETSFVARALPQLPQPSLLEKQWQKQGMLAYANIPLVADQRFLGILQLVSDDPYGFDAEQMKVLREVAEMLTLAIRQTQLRESLQKSNEELQELLRLKHETLQNLSHELRSPLALIRGYTQLLRDGLLGPLTAEQEEAFDILDSKGDQLLFMLERLLTLQTIDRETLDKEALDPARLLWEVVEPWKVLTGNRGIQLQLQLGEALPELVADRCLLMQLVSNLLDNALKFSPENSRIEVRAWQEGAELVIAVADQGVGIAPEKLARIFERFYQVKDKSQPRQGGAGIGLALCQTIATAHGGRLWAASGGHGQGTTFYLALPL